MTSLATACKIVGRLVGVALLASCHNEPDPLPYSDCDPEASIPDSEVLSSPVVSRFFDFPQADMCEGNLNALDSHALWVAQAWEEEFVPDIEYNLFDSAAHACWPCPSFASACASDGLVNTTRVPDRHELAHAAHGNNCSALLEEGWATLYSNPFEDSETTGDLRAAMESIAQNGYLGASYYPLAARFVAFLIENWGIETVRELCKNRFTTTDELSQALDQSVGMNLDAFESQFAEYPTWTLGQLRQDEICESDSEPAYTAPAEWTVEIDCNNANAEGVDDVWIWTHTTVEIPTPGSYTFSFNSPSDVQLEVELRSCVRDGMAAIDYERNLAVIWSQTPAVFLKQNLAGGVYVLRLKTKDNLSAQANPNIEVTVAQWP